MRNLTAEERAQFANFIKPQRLLVKTSDVPPMTKTAWESFRRAVDTNEKTRKGIHVSLSDKKLGELKPEIREQRENELRGKGRQLIVFITDLAISDLNDATAAIDAEVARASRPLSKPLPKVDWARLVGSEGERAKIDLANLEQNRAVERRLARQDLDGRIDRALAKTAGNPALDPAQRVVAANEALVKLYRDAVAEGDAVLLDEFEGHELRRLQREEPEGMSVMLNDEVTRAREARLPDLVRALLPHKEALGHAMPFLTAMKGEANKGEFWDPNGRVKSVTSVVREYMPELWEE
ncbi:MAG TPA: hypothetical protein VKM54_21025 [Myxococcota bacterium]|nr:hypothetical protein [Myxococcota bacterium]